MWRCMGLGGSHGVFSNSTPSFIVLKYLKVCGRGQFEKFLGLKLYLNTYQRIFI